MLVIAKESMFKHIIKTQSCLFEATETWEQQFGRRVGQVIECIFQRVGNGINF